MSNRALNYLDAFLINFIDSKLGFIQRNQFLFLYQDQHHQLCPCSQLERLFTFTQVLPQDSDEINTHPVIV